MSHPQLGSFAEIIIDSYFIIDLECNILDFNGAFRSMVPRAVARKLKQMKCHEALQLDICKERCIADECWRSGRHVRLDEIRGTLVGEDKELRFILSAIPIRDEEGTIIGAMEMQRNVTDEALVQDKYKRQMEASATQQKQLEVDLQQRTLRMVELSRQLYQAQETLLKARAGLL